MQIIWKGQSCVQLIASRIKQDPVKIVIDPYQDSVGFKLPSLEADIALVTHDHEDHNNLAAEGEKRGHNTIYTIEAEDMKVCHLGDLGQPELTPKQVEAIGSIDILFIPVGGVYTIGAKEAAKVISQIEPKVVIPMHYAIPKLKYKLEGVEDFLKAMGAKAQEPQQKIILKSKDLSEEEIKIMLLTP
ncbi:MAG: MBL fold metallo-hydrolase [Candidatus Wildermuthbacteria bacterium]|nr:MBL fold metallo-hydrolase [Candidatus Wildermuthbacteria bacterium]